METGVEGLAVEERQAAAENFRRSCEHRWPRGRGGAHPGRSSRMRNVRTPSGSGMPSGVAGKPEVTKAQFPGGNRMLKKRTPVRRKATGNRDKVVGPSADRPV